LLDPEGWQRRENARAGERRRQALAMFAPTAAERAAQAAADAERTAVRRAYAPAELAAVAKDIEGLRTTLGQLHRRPSGADQERALGAVRAVARIVGDTGAVLKRFDAAERETLARMPGSIRSRHEAFMRQATAALTGFSAPPTDNVAQLDRQLS